MNSSDFFKKQEDQEDDEDIRLFREDYPDVYDLIVRLINGKCDDKTIENFIEQYREVFSYGEQFLFYHVQSDNARPFCFDEVTHNCILYHLFYILKGIRLSKN
jgi:hypothetical protein